MSNNKDIMEILTPTQKAVERRPNVTPKTPKQKKFENSPQFEST